MAKAAKTAKTAKRTRAPAVGAHVSAAGGLYKAVGRAEEIGAEAIQIFGAAPQMWRRKQHSEEEIARFRAAASDARLGPVFIHAVYLINLASPDPQLLEKSVAALTAELRLGSALGAAGVIVHVGSHMGAGFDAQLPQIVQAIRRALDDSPDDIPLCLENNAGAGRSVGSTFEELAAMVEGAASARVRLCLRHLPPARRRLRHRRRARPARRHRRLPRRIRRRPARRRPPPTTPKPS